MKIKKGFVLRNMGDQFVVVAVGAAAQQFRGMLRLNAMGAEIWNRIAAGTDEDALVAGLAEEYDAPAGQIAADVGRILATLREVGALDE